MRFMISNSKYHGVACEPDQLESIDNGVPENFVVSRDQNGETLSLYRDPAWDMTVYGATAKWKFDTWHQSNPDALSEQLTNEIKAIFWMAIFAPECRDRYHGKKISSFSGFLSCLRSLAKIAHYCGTSLADAHTSPRFQVALKTSTIAYLEGSENPANAIALRSLLKVVRAIRGKYSAQPDWEIVPEDDFDEWMKRLAGYGKIKQKNAKRTPLIPSRICANLITGIESEMDKLAPHLDNFISLYRGIYSDPKIWCNNRKAIANNVIRIRQNGTIVERPGPDARYLTIKETLEKYGLYDFLEEENIRCNLDALKQYLTAQRYLASLFVFLFTGMRHSEVIVMPYECYSEMQIPHFGKVSFIFSHTKKMEPNHYSDALAWVTSPVVLKAIKRRFST
jgi:hypothetical protein